MLQRSDSAVVQLVRLWPAGLGLRPAPLALLVVGVRVALVAVALVEIPLLVKDAAACAFVTIHPRVSVSLCVGYKPDRSIGLPSFVGAANFRS